VRLAAINCLDEDGLKRLTETGLAEALGELGALGVKSTLTAGTISDGRPKEGRGNFDSTDGRATSSPEWKTALWLVRREEEIRPFELTEGFAREAEDSPMAACSEVIDTRDPNASHEIDFLNGAADEDSDDDNEGCLCPATSVRRLFTGFTARVDSTRLSFEAWMASSEVVSISGRLILDAIAKQGSTRLCGGKRKRSGVVEGDFCLMFQVLYALA
jgi:hypothetical protein